MAEKVVLPSSISEGYAATSGSRMDIEDEDKSSDEHKTTERVEIPAGLSSVQLGKHYADLAKLLHEFDEKAKIFKDRMTQILEQAPDLTKLAVIWEEQAKEWATDRPAGNADAMDDAMSGSDEHEEVEEDDSILYI